MILKEKLEKEIELEIKNTICMATQLRQNETRKIAKNVDAMIIVGGKNSSNTKKLFDISSQICKIVQWVETKDELNINEIRQCQNIGMMAGASTPKESIIDIEEKLKAINEE